jgi:hypothetical protein
LASNYDDSSHDDKSTVDKVDNSSSNNLLLLQADHKMDEMKNSFKNALTASGQSADLPGENFWHRFILTKLARLRKTQKIFQ